MLTGPSCKDPTAQLSKDLAVVRGIISRFDSASLSRFDSAWIDLDISPADFSNMLDPTIAQGNFNTQSISVIYRRFSDLSDYDRYDTLLHEFRHLDPINFALTRHLPNL